MAGKLERTSEQMATLREQLVRRRMRRHEDHHVPMLYLNGPLDGMRSMVSDWMLGKPGTIIQHRVGQGMAELCINYRHRDGGCFVFDRVEPFHTGGGEAYRGVHEELRSRDP